MFSEMKNLVFSQFILKLLEKKRKKEKKVLGF